MEKRSLLDRLTKSAPEKTAAPQAKNIPSPMPGRRAAEKTPITAEQCMLDVYQTDDEIVIKALIAGVRPEDLDISLANDTLTIRGVRTEGDAVRPEDYYYRECYFGPFSRSVILPESAGDDTITAKLKNGILTVRIPKAKKTQIAINTH